MYIYPSLIRVRIRVFEEQRNKEHNNLLKFLFYIILFKGLFRRSVYSKTQSREAQGSQNTEEPSNLSLGTAGDEFEEGAEALRKLSGPCSL